MDDIKQFARIIKDIKFAMLVTVDTIDGSLHSRPMTLLDAEFDGTLWFFASRSSETVKQIQKNTHINLSFSNPQDFSFLSATGNAVVTLDKDKEKELWRSEYAAWFPQGLADPDLCLIKVTVRGADYWDSPGSPLVHLYNFAKSMVTGQNNSPSVNKLGRHEHFTLN